MVVSTAVEDKVPDVRAAEAEGIGILHRSELLARYVAQHKTIAVTGTSGKSTVTAMIFSILRATGRQPGLLTGGALAELQADGHLGNAWAPGPDSERFLIIEADESDGSVVRYQPWAGVVLNLGLDHKEPAEVLELISASGLRGCGGAGFPVGRKWSLTAGAAGDRRYIFCNADEGEPGTFKDRVLLTERADLLIEGMTIGAYAMGCEEGIIYVRAEGGFDVVPARTEK